MIKYKLVNKNHPICQDAPPKDLSQRMKTFWKSRDLLNSDKAIITFDQNQIIGFFRYDKEGLRHYGHGTYVLPQYRSQGIAQKLWSKVLIKEKVKIMHVYASSNNAIKLIKKMQILFPKINWHIIKY